MENWSLFWCFYNSVAFSNITDVAILGAFALVIPALAELPELMKPKLGERHTEYILFEYSRSRTKRYGIYSLLYSILVVISYLYILKQMGGRTCPVNNVNVSAIMTMSLVAVYFFTGFGLIALGMFYLSLQVTKNKHEKLKNKQ